MGEVLVFDIETNGYKPSEIFCLGVFDLGTRVYKDYVGDDVIDGLIRLRAAKLIIGHNIKGFDIPVIERLTEGLVVFPKTMIVDTLDISRHLFPGMKGHKIADWGEIFDFPKGDWKRFDKFYPELLPYMRRDVEINVKMYEFFVSQLEEHAPKPTRHK